MIFKYIFIIYKMNNTTQNIEDNNNVLDFTLLYLILGISIGKFVITEIRKMINKKKIIKNIKDNDEKLNIILNSLSSSYNEP